MRNKIQIALLLTTTWLCLSCATIIDVQFDDGLELARHRTWSWLSSPDAGPRVHVDKAIEDPHALDVQISSLIEEGLRERGFDLVTEEPDFYITYSLNVDAEIVSVLVPRAPYLLSSYSSAASYIVEGSNSVDRLRLDIRLQVAAMEPEERIIWQGELVRTTDSETLRLLSKDVAALMMRFPYRKTSSE